MAAETRATIERFLFPFTFTLTFTPRVLAEVVTKTYFIDLSGYPRWLVILGATLVTGLVIWIAMKLLKVALWIFLIVVLVGGFAWAMTELLR